MATQLVEIELPDAPPPDPCHDAETILALGMDASRRRIYLVGEIEEGTYLRFVAALHALDATDGIITVYLNSGGGEEACGFGIYDAIRAAHNEVVIVGLGNVMSIAALIMQAGDLRAMSPNSTFMIHGGSISMAGPVANNTLMAVTKEIARVSDDYIQLLAKHSKQKVSAIKAYCDTESYFSADEALRLGFVDAIIRHDGGVVTKSTRSARQKASLAGAKKVNRSPGKAGLKKPAKKKAA